jgi:tRNA-specific 2-thiouridylase
MKKNTQKQKTVFVGLSGGVDSSVSAHLLIEAGYNVVGVFIRTWTPDFIECTWRDERRDAIRVAAKLGIPFLECDLEQVYKRGVADYMISEYRHGRVPNPDVMCNREVKFGGFWHFAQAHGADYIATGHYAQNIFNKKTGLYELHTGVDANKDQSYFLYTLTQADLEHTLFPIGHLQKSAVRKLAEKTGLHTATKKDSQGVCFLGPLDMKSFLAEFIPKKKGDVLNEAGAVVGVHDGAVFFALGERHGFTITQKTATDTAQYVVAKDIVKNTITVSSSPEQYMKEHTPTNQLSLHKNTWVGDVPSVGEKYHAQIRYHGTLHAVRIMERNDVVVIETKEPLLVSPGQSVVLYKNTSCIGGGVVL